MKQKITNNLYKSIPKKRNRKKCLHGKSIYDCNIKTNGIICGISMCHDHLCRLRECKKCKIDSISEVYIMKTPIKYKKEQIQKFIEKIDKKGCRCPTERYRYISSIVGCNKKNGCCYDEYKCTICQKTFRYGSIAFQHIRCCHTAFLTHDTIKNKCN
jgi:hypothetical protein